MLGKLRQSVDAQIRFRGVETLTDARSAFGRLLVTRKTMKREKEVLMGRLRGALEELSVCRATIMKGESRMRRILLGMEALKDENASHMRKINELSSQPRDPHLVSENENLRTQYAELDRIATGLSQRLRAAEDDLQAAR